MYYFNNEDFSYLEAYERKPRTLDRVVGSYTSLNNELIKEAIALANKEMPTQEIQIEYKNITQELKNLTKRMAELQDKYIL